MLINFSKVLDIFSPKKPFHTSKFDIKKIPNNSGFENDLTKKKSNSGINVILMGRRGIRGNFSYLSNLAAAFFPDRDLLPVCISLKAVLMSIIYIRELRIKISFSNFFLSASVRISQKQLQKHKNVIFNASMLSFLDIQ